MNDKFYFYRTFYDVLKELPLELRDELCMAILSYGFDGTIGELSETSRIHFAFFKQKLDFLKSRSANGSKGGRPRKVVECKNQTL